MVPLDEVTLQLVAEADRALQIRVAERAAAMLREMRYLLERGDPYLALAHRHGWGGDRLRILCGLNAFYQVILGPVASSARERTGELGAGVPIVHGSLRVDSERASRVREAHRAFMDIIRDVPGGPRILTAPHFRELIFALGSALEGPHDDA